MNVDRFALPLARPLETAAGTIDRREGYIVTVEVEDATGVGEATPLAGWTESLAACAGALHSVGDPEATLESGVLDGTPAARHGVSLAVLDARARAHDRPLYRELGGTERVDAVPVNATVGAGSPAVTADAVAAAVREGYPAVKVKVGASDLATDLERLDAVRDRCPAVALRADANGAWARATADRALDALADRDVALVEQPLAPEDLSGHAALRGGPVAVALDEGLHEHGLDAVLAAEAADAIVVKPMALGGVDRARAVATRALDADLDVIVSTTIDGAYARAGAVHLAASLPSVLPSGIATGDRLAADLRTDVLPVRDGAIGVPHRKGNIPSS